MSPAAWCSIFGCQGLSGLDFQAELTKAGIKIPIIFMTGHGDIPMSVKAMKAGAIDFLTKPFRDQDMLDAVGRAIESDRTRRSSESAMTDVRARFETLTVREREIMGLVTTGLDEQTGCGRGRTEPHYGQDSPRAYHRKK
jgi:Response regulator